MNVRPASASDAVTLAELSGQLGYPASIPQMAARLTTVADDPDHVLVAEEGGAVVGWVHVSLPRLTVDEDSAEIWGLVVAEAVRGAGVGGLLVAEVEHWATGRCAPSGFARTWDVMGRMSSIDAVDTRG